MYLILASSLNENMKLAKALQALLEALGQESSFINLVDLDLPMYDSYKEETHGIPPDVLVLCNMMDTAEGYVVVAPEYNYSIPPVLTNAIAWVSRTGDDFRRHFTLKTVQLATHSGGGGNDVMQAMRTQFTKLGAVVMPREIITTYRKALSQESARKTLKQFISIRQD